MLKNSFAILVLNIAVCLSAQDKRPDPKQVDEIIFCMINGCADWQTITNDRRGWVDVKFVSDGTQYSIRYAKWPQRYLTFWIGVPGSSDSDSLDTFSDDLIDGSVDFGSDRDRQRDLFRNRTDADLKWQNYWQQRYVDAVAVTMKYLHKHGILRKHQH